MRGFLRGILAAALPLLAPAQAAAAQIPVLHREGTAHGFLVLRNQAGAPIADGDLLQGEKDGAVETKLVFRFRDGSSSEETALFTQEGTFRLVRYELEQRGPAFPSDLHATLDARNGRYTVRARERKSGDETKDEGVLKLPPDTSNGLVPVLVKNLAKGGAVHIVAFLPKPKILEISIDASGESAATFGAGSLRVTRYVVKPQLGAVMKAVAKLLGKMPPDTRVWIASAEPPAFLRFEGSLATGLPAWRIESALPSLPD